MSGADSALLSLSYEEVAALSGEAPMAARSGVARGGGRVAGFPSLGPAPHCPPRSNSENLRLETSKISD